MRDQAAINLHESLPRFLFELDKLLEHFLRHWRGCIAAMAAMLDQDGDRDFRMIYRSVGNEPGMVSIEVRKLFALQVSTLHLDDLRGAGFSGDLNHLGPGRAAGTVGATDNIGKGVAHSV